MPLGKQGKPVTHIGQAYPDPDRRARQRALGGLLRGGVGEDREAEVPVEDPGIHSVPLDRLPGATDRHLHRAAERLDQRFE